MNHEKLRVVTRIGVLVNLSKYNVQIINTNGKSKEVKFALKQAMKTQRGSRGIDLLFL
jgi:hypothetical protein